MALKPGIPKGTRDFLSKDVAKRNYIFSIIKAEFEKFGFNPIETPTFENSETLMGKYGEEGDRLIFKILNSGDYLEKIDDEILNEKNTKKLTPKISEKALRYDLTVPFARFVVQHQNELEFPFKRYQIQPVWRADRPQKSRYREFYQCDADVVGSDSLWQEVEFVMLYDIVFSKLGLKGATIKLNNRKILAGIAEVIEASDKLIDFTVALDKLDKIGEEGVVNEMLEKGIALSAVEKIKPLLHLKGSNFEKLQQLKGIISSSEIGLKGIEEIEFILQQIAGFYIQSTLELDITLARGLNYYTGAIFEVKAPSEVSIGSIGGGGRYDDLTSIFGKKDLSGVGISFGLDRIFDVLEELKLFPETVSETSKILFLNYGNEEALFSLKTIQKLRSHSIKAELYPDNAKLPKQFSFAEKKGIPFVALMGSNEIASQLFKIKNITTSEQFELSETELITFLQS